MSSPDLAGATIVETAPAAPFEVLDALGWCRLHRRAADLDGSIPLRAARACVPLLEGNAYGWQLGAVRPIAITRRRASWILADDAMMRAARACIPYLAAHGYLHGQWPTLLADGPLSSARGFAGALGWWTGLLVRAGAAPLRVTHAGNRRSRDVDLDDVVVTEPTRWVPLVLELRPRDNASFRLGAEIATLAPVSSAVPLQVATLAEHRAFGEAHLGFFDRAYFDDKRVGPTKKYRGLLAQAADERSTATGAEQVAIAALAGPTAVTLETASRVHGADGPAAGDGAVRRFVVRNLVGFTARDDGLAVHIEPDRGALDRLAGAIEATWRAVFGAAVVDQHRGALWYLTKYFTPHVAGEPHFFVKPPALFSTPAGWSLLVDGIHGRGYDVMRGVVRTDRFHAAPAVFALDRGATVEVSAGTPLCRLLPVVHGADAIEPRSHPPLPTAAQP